MQPADAEGYPARPRPVLGLARPWPLRSAIWCPSPWTRTRKPQEIAIAYRKQPRPSFSTQTQEEEFQRLWHLQYRSYWAARNAATDEAVAERKVRDATQINYVWRVHALRDVRRRIQPRYDKYERATAALFSFVEREAVVHADLP